MSIPRKAIYLIVTAALAGSPAIAAAATAGGAESAATGKSAARMGAAAQQQDAVKGSQLIGATVQDRSGGQLGKVADLAIAADGKVSHLVIETQQPAAAGSQLVAIPWKAAKLQGAADAIVLDISKDRLARAPHIAKDAWAQRGAAGDWMRRSDRYFGEAQVAQDVVPQSEQWAQSMEARDEEGGPLPSLADMDTDGDGKVSEAEASPYERIENNFSSIDRNSDGTLDEAELSAFEAQWTGSESAPMEEIRELTEDAAEEGQRPSE